MANNPRDDDEFKDVEHIRKEPRPDFSKPLPRSKLPKDLEDTLNDDSKYWEVLYAGEGQESTDTAWRYAAYARRLRTIMGAAHRYVAYTSDIGESFRPVAHPNWVRAAYGVSWAYLIGDVSYEGYKAYVRNQKALYPELDNTKTAPSALAVPGKVAPVDHWGTVVVQRAIFQSVASMGLPAFTIHSIVKYSGKAMKDVKNVRLRTWGPIGLGLAAVPALPYMFDEPVEHVTEWLFHKGFEAIGGPDAVGHRSAAETVKEGTGRTKEKEL